MALILGAEETINIEKGKSLAVGGWWYSGPSAGSEMGGGGDNTNGYGPPGPMKSPTLSKGISREKRSVPSQQRNSPLSRKKVFPKNEIHVESDHGIRGGPERSGGGEVCNSKFLGEIVGVAI